MKYNAQDGSGTRGSRRALTVLEGPGNADGQACNTCASNVYIWEEEIALVRTMHEVKQQVRTARKRGDDAEIEALRERFRSLRARMEGVRRRRLDSLGHTEYD